MVSQLDSSLCSFLISAQLPASVIAHSSRLTSPLLLSVGSPLLSHLSLLRLLVLSVPIISSFIITCNWSLMLPTPRLHFPADYAISGFSMFRILFSFIYHVLNVHFCSLFNFILCNWCLYSSLAAWIDFTMNYIFSFALNETYIQGDQMGYFTLFFW